MVSWIARLAARYDLTGADLLAWLNGGHAVDVWRMRRLDWQGEAEFDQRLAIAADLDLGQVEALRIPPPAGLEAERWSRRFTAWCPNCVREDIERHGESSIRFPWKLGFQVTCAVHGSLLADRCGFCGARQCAFGPVRGRLRLLCGGCRRVADRVPQSSSWPVLDARPGPLGVRRNAAAARLVATMQADLWGSLGFPMPVLTGPWSVGTAADFAVIVRELGAAFLHPAWLPAGRLGRPEGLESDFTTVSADVAFDVLGLVAAVLSEVVTGEASGVERVQPGLAGREVVPVDLGSLISGLSEQALTTLERSAGRWPAMIAEATLHAAATARDRRDRKNTIAELEKRAPRLHGTPQRIRAIAVRRMARRAVRKRRAGDSRVRLAPVSGLQAPAEGRFLANEAMFSSE